MKRLLIAVIAACVSAAGAQAQTYPSRPLTLIVPYPAGGPSDALARVLVEALRPALGQTVVIENVSGAGGAIGTGRVARAAPDGYTLSLGHVQTHVLNAAVQNLNYDVVADFEPVTLIADTPTWIALRANFPAKDYKEMVAWMMANPGKATFGTVGVGGPDDIAAAHFQRHTGATFQMVPYKGGAPLMQDLIAGQIDLTFGQAANYLNPVRTGQLKAFAVLSNRRWWASPDTPTIVEAGGPDVQASFWHGMWAPKGTPKDVIAKLNAAVSQALDDAAVKKRFSDIGQESGRRTNRIPPRWRRNRRLRSSAGGPSSRRPASRPNKNSGMSAAR